MNLCSTCYLNSFASQKLLKIIVGVCCKNKKPLFQKNGKNGYDLIQVGIAKKF
jgi:hypothetical protein